MSSLQINKSDSISLAQLLSMNCTAQLDDKIVRGLLGNYRSVIALTRDAVSSFLDGKYADPLVGENACQIRAALYCDLARNEKVIEELKTIARVLEQRPISIDDISLPKRTSLGEVLETKGLDVRFSNEMGSILGPIVFGHILTVTKVSKLSIDKETVLLAESNEHQRLVGMGTGFAKELIKEGRKVLSNGSISYLRQEVDLLPMSAEREDLSSVLQSQVITDHFGLQTAPMLAGMKILLGSMKVHGTAILLKDRMINDGKEGVTLTMLFEPKGIGEPYRVVEDLTKVDEKQPVVIVEAVAISNEERDPQEIAQSLGKVGVETIILANTAAHTQYGGASKHLQPPDSEERERLKGVAKDLGLCADNPRLCRIYHIYAGRVRDHLQKEAV